MGQTRLYKGDLVDLAERAPADRLRPYVRRYTAWRDRGGLAVRRRHVPTGDIPIVINRDARVRINCGNDRAWAEHLAFTAGLHDVFTISESAGRNVGIQIDFTVVGARLFFGRPLDEIANRTVALDDLMGAAANRLVVKVFDAATWDTRFDILDAEIGAAVNGRRLSPQIEWAWSTLARTAGAVRVDAVRRETGWSERHFAATFRRELGLTPKALARVLRFGRAVGALSRGHDSSLAEVALSCGYYDQAHFNHDFQQFAGVAPRALLESRTAPVPGFNA
jgi:AraC-like DNA-binding protein